MMTHTFVRVLLARLSPCFLANQGKMGVMNVLRVALHIVTTQGLLPPLMAPQLGWAWLSTPWCSMILRIWFAISLLHLLLSTVPFDIQPLRRAARSVAHGARWRIRIALWRMHRMTGLSDHQTGDAPPQAAAAQLSAVAPILLKHHLAHPECLALWRTSRALAYLVWQHAPCVRLSLSGGILARARTGAHLAALIASSKPPACIPLSNTLQRINALNLSGMQLSVDGLRSVFLELPHLHTLALKACGLAGSTAPHPPPIPTLRSVACTSCRSPGGSPLAVALSLCNLASLLHLTTDDLAVCSMLGTLISLQRLTITTGQVTDEFDSLLRHPQLREVCVRRLAIFKDYRDRSCSWRELRVLEHAFVDSLAALPLQGIAPLGGIQRCVVQQFISRGPDSSVQALGTRLVALCNVRSLVFEPAITLKPTHLGVLGWFDNSYSLQDRLGLGLNEAGFEVGLHYEDAPGRMLQLAARHLVGGTLVLSECQLRDPRVLRSLLLLPPAVTSIIFWRSAHIPSDPRTLFIHLPQHVTRLMVKTSSDGTRWVYHRGTIATIME